MASHSGRLHNCQGLWVVGCEDCHRLLLEAFRRFRLMMMTSSSRSDRPRHRQQHLRYLRSPYLHLLGNSSLNLILFEGDLSALSYKNLEFSAVLWGLVEQHGRNNSLLKTRSLHDMPMGELED